MGKPMKLQPIKLVKLAKATTGFRILPSWRRPDPATFARKVDLWLPELAPGLSLMNHYRQRNTSWEELSFIYTCELRVPSCQNLLKPLALLSMRRKLVLLCDCEGRLKCPNLILAQVLNDCRTSRDFRIKGKCL